MSSALVRECLLEYNDDELETEWAAEHARIVEELNANLVNGIAQIARLFPQSFTPEMQGFKVDPEVLIGKVSLIL